MADIPESTKLLTVTQADVTDADRAAVTAFHTIQIKRIIAGDKTMGDNRDVIEQAFACHRIEAERRATRAALPDPVKLAERFCATPLPETVSADLCATQPGPGRYGTNLMTVAEAAVVFRAALSTLSRAAPPAMDREAVELDWRLVAKLAGEHGVRYRTNRAFEQFVTAILSTLSADAIRQGEGKTEVAFEVWQDEFCVASSTDEVDAHHYLAVYGQDGPVKLMRAVTVRTELTASHASDGGKA